MLYIINTWFHLSPGHHVIRHFDSRDTWLLPADKESNGRDNSGLAKGDKHAHGRENRDRELAGAVDELRQSGADGDLERPGSPEAYEEPVNSGLEGELTSSGAQGDWEPPGAREEPGCSGGQGQPEGSGAQEEQ